VIERQKALEDVQKIPWKADEETIGTLFDIWWSNTGLVEFEKFLGQYGIKVVTDAV